MKSRPSHLLIYWLLIICFILPGLQSHHVSAYQNQEATPEAVTATPAEETPVFATSTAEATALEKPVDTATEATVSPTAPTPSTPVENSPTPEATAKPLPVTLSGDYAPDEVLVRFRKSASEENIMQCLSQTDAQIVSSIEELSVRVVQVPSGKVAETIAMLATCPEVRYAEPNYTASITNTIPSDPNWSWQYGLVNIRAPQGWDYSTGSTAVTIAILDTGVDLDHPDLVSKIVPGYDIINGDSIPDDDNGHGTHVAGIAAASSNNGIGVAGVSWGARIMPVKVLDPIGFGFLSDIADGIIWATNNGAQVINLSLGSNSDSQALEDAVNYAYSRGVILVAAAGNNNGSPLYPALYPNVIAVGAVDNANNRIWNSNFGSELDLVAPGWFIYSTTINGYGYNTGTSMAAPYVSGLAAVLYGIPGNASSALVTSQMESSARDLGPSGFDVYHGFGLIQMDAALKLAPIQAVSDDNKKNGGNLYSQPLVATFAPVSTNTNTPTVTSSPTSYPATATPTASATSTLQPSSSSTLEKNQAQSRNLPAWQMPVAGIAFIVAGLLLMWAVRQKTGRRF